MTCGPMSVVCGVFVVSSLWIYVCGLISGPVSVDSSLWALVCEFLSVGLCFCWAPVWGPVSVVSSLWACVCGPSVSLCLWAPVSGSCL